LKRRLVELVVFESVEIAERAQKRRAFGRADQAERNGFLETFVFEPPVDAAFLF
jgi:hypothetical protein